MIRNPSNVTVGRGCSPRTTQPTTVQDRRRDYRMATPAQSDAIRRKFIAAGIIKPVAA
jgi:hypothetical protein